MDLSFDVLAVIRHLVDFFFEELNFFNKHLVMLSYASVGVKLVFFDAWLFLS